jgi:DNA-binding beta-propeller fold protein YncE
MVLVPFITITTLPPHIMQPLTSIFLACVSTTLAAASVIAPAAPGVTSSYYSLDSTFPTGLKGLNVSQVTALALVNTSGSTLELHVAQRGTALPPFIVLDTVTGGLLRTYGVKGLKSPHGMASTYAVDPTTVPSTLWVADIANGTLLSLNPETGEVYQLVGSKGLGVNPPQFSAPADLALDATSHALFCSDGDGGEANRVMKLSTTSPNSRPAYVLGCGNTSAAPGCFSSPHSTAFSPHWGHLWVADRGHNRLQVFSGATGALLGVWGAEDGCFGVPGAQPWGVRVDDVRGRLVVADGGPAGNPSGGEVGAVYVLGINEGAGWGPNSVPPCKGALLQTLVVPNQATAKPHELEVDNASGDIYLADIGVPPTVVKYKCVA